MRRKEVEAITGRSRSSIYDGIATGTFPKPVKTGARAVAWPESVIRAWIAERMEGARHEKGTRPRRGKAPDPEPV